jgi:hypothetical protein
VFGDTQGFLFGDTAVKVALLHRNLEIRKKVSYVLIHTAQKNLLHTPELYAHTDVIRRLHMLTAVNSCAVAVYTAGNYLCWCSLLTLITTTLSAVHSAYTGEPRIYSKQRPGL